MNSSKMHDDEIDIDEELVQNLIATQFPQWKELFIKPVASTGTDNALFMLGEELVIRLPRINTALELIDKENVWLPILAPQLPTPIPTPVAQGKPSEEYPWNWSILQWMSGNIVTHDEDLFSVAQDLAQFINALRAIDPAKGRALNVNNNARGAPLLTRDTEVRQAVEQLTNEIDTSLAIELWESALRTPEYTAEPSWIHGDLQPGNILVSNGKLSGVIDFGCLGIGDPACDLIPAWTLFSSENRMKFRDALDVDDAMWDRGRGWALSIALIALPYYLHSSPFITRLSRFTIEQVFTDVT
ncbi:MAG TPA: aminoglycoside phosphotransferase family protein [Acidimicrobiia bacterium]|nr:aminoglycoside phosphotransferase family protein [Acidimicrobiia bacterium]